MLNKGSWQTDPQPHLKKSYKEYKFLYRIGFQYQSFKFLADYLMDDDSNTLWFIYPYNREFKKDLLVFSDIIKESNYWQKDIRVLLQALDEVVFEYFNDVTDDEEISVQLVKGIKCGCKIMPERARKDPRTQDDIVCAATVKPFAKFSEDFRKSIQEQYDLKKDG